MSQRRAGQPFAFGQLEQGGDIATGRGGAIVRGGYGGREGTGREVMQDHGATVAKGGALAQFGVRSREQFADGQTKPRHKVAHV
jgi:hypothetical protein